MPVPRPQGVRSSTECDEVSATREPIVHLDHVWKQFRLRYESQRSFQEAFVSLLRGRRVRQPAEYFWSLQDVSFAVAPGECLGIIGPNGSGKSTLLKTVAGVLEPTSGVVTVSGRVGALLELGAGFHPDLTGRENVYLNASILGVSRVEARAKLEEILSFAEIERFADIPVKYYSSGMYMRLGFSIAMYVDPAVLLVDEVLAVGDQKFQAKCIGKISELRSQGVTILWVSHDLPTVQKICTRAIWLQDGSVEMDDVPDVVIPHYVRHSRDLSRLGVRDQSLLDDSTTESEQQALGSSDSVALQSEGAALSINRYGNGMILVRHVEMVGADGEARWVFTSNEHVRIRLHYHTELPVKSPVFSILIHREDGLYVTSSNTYQRARLPSIAGAGSIEVEFPSFELARGSYLLSIGAYAEPDPPYWADPADFHDRVYRFEVDSEWQFHGVVAPRTAWRLLENDGAAPPDLNGPPDGAPGHPEALREAFRGEK